MKLSVKFLVIFALLMLSFGIGGDVSTDFMAMCDNHHTDVCNNAGEALDSSSDAPVLSSIDGDEFRGSGWKSFALSDVEMGFKPVSETYSFHHNHRMRRAVEFIDFFKGLVHGLCLRENLLVLDKSKSYHSDEDPYTAQSGCEYYVFALRRILI